MGLPNVPTQRTHDFDFRVASALNSLLNRITFFQFTVAGQPAAGESIVKTQFPVPVTIVTDQCFGWAGTAASSDAEVTLLIDGASAGTYTFPAADQDADVSITTVTIPAFTDFEIVAPTPQDATLADITITLAASI